MTPNPPHRQNLDITLPIAPNANHRKVGEEGVLPQALLPAEAKNWLTHLQQGGKDITGLTLCGPGDVLTSWPATKACLDLLAGIPLPVSLVCLGLSGAECVPELLPYNIKNIVVMVDTVNPETAMALYQWLRPEKKTIPLAQGAQLLIAHQEEAVKAMVSAGLEVIVRTELTPGINDTEIAGIAKRMADLGVKKMELIGGESEAKAAKDYLSVELLSPEVPMSPPLSSSCTSSELPKGTAERPYVAVASSDGMDVNLHLGQTEKLLIYGLREDGLVCLVDTRNTPASGVANRWQGLADLLPDCFALLASHAGEAPRAQLATAGIQVVLVEDQIEGLVDVLFDGGKKKGKGKK